MFAVVNVAGKQVKMTKDSVVRVPRISEEVGKNVEYNRVLLLNNDAKTTVGTPYISSAKVSATVVAHDRDKKTRAHVYKRRKQYKRTWGFRESFTVLKVTAIQGA